MAGKIDKEVLKKHHFWFLFAPIGLFMLIAWYALMADVPDAIGEQQEKNVKKKKDLAANSKALPRKAIDEYGSQLGVLDSQRTILWKEGWNQQKDLFSWPKGYTEEQKNVYAPLKFGDEIPEKTASAREQFKAERVYANEYQQLIKTLEPMQFRESWETLLSYVRNWGTVPSSEDIWLAMEDFWIQREILLAIHQVNANAARFTMVDTSKDTPNHRVFRSRFWQVDLQLADVKGKQILKGKLKNVSGRLQVMGIGNTMKLKVKFGARDFDFLVEGSPVEADAEIDVKTIDKHTIPADWQVKSIDSVEQIFDSRTVPVKRLDYLKLGYSSDRFKDVPRKMAKFSEVIATKEAGPAPAVPVPMVAPEVNPDNPEAAPPPPAAKANLPPKSQNGLERNRYIEATEQLRRMPLGFVVITDQSFMKDIEEAMLAIKLRFQMTQVEFIRFHGSLNYSGTGGSPGGVASLMPKLGEGGRPLDSQGNGGPSNSREDQFSANLMELTIYGIVSLYERSPDDKPTPPKTAGKK